MGILTLLLAVILILAVIFIVYIVTGKTGRISRFGHRLTYLKSAGLFTMIIGILGQLLGLVLAFGAIERAGDISPQLMFGGLKVSMYTTLYGILIYLLSILLWFILDLWYHAKVGEE
jgi:biopolymer transport protein ExbB/TolQ